jgi:ABC-type uncharacterized transport system permease subunit
MDMLNKYHFSYFKRLLAFYWQDLNAYPLRRIAYIFWPILEFIPIMFLMGIISQSSLFTYSTKEIYLYYFFVWALFYNLNQHWNLFEEVYYGKIANRLTRPLTLTRNYFYDIIADKTINLMFLMSMVILLGIIFIGPISLFGILFYILGIIMISFLIVSLLFASFWLGKNFGIIAFFGLIIDFSAGRILPLDLFPEIIQKIFLVLPFNLMVYTPAKIYLGQLTPNIWIILQYAIWIFIFYALARFLEKKGLRKYDGYGG